MQCDQCMHTWVCVHMHVCVIMMMSFILWMLLVSIHTSWRQYRRWLRNWGSYKTGNTMEWNQLDHMLIFVAVVFQFWMFIMEFEYCTTSFIVSSIILLAVLTIVSYEVVTPKFLIKAHCFSDTNTVTIFTQSTPVDRGLGRTALTKKRSTIL